MDDQDTAADGGNSLMLRSLRTLRQLLFYFSLGGIFGAISMYIHTENSLGTFTGKVFDNGFAVCFHSGNALLIGLSSRFNEDIEWEANYMAWEVDDGIEGEFDYYAPGKLGFGFKKNQDGVCIRSPQWFVIAALALVATLAKSKPRTRISLRDLTAITCVAGIAFTAIELVPEVLP